MARQVLFEHRTSTGQLIRIIQGDLTEEPVDAIVNAANEYLTHGGGVAGAIARKGGPEIQAESDRWVREHGPVRTGTAAITTAGRLPARYVIHAVGPIWRNRGDEDALLASAVTSALTLAAEHEVRSISLPAISSGIFGFPKPRAARVILDAVDTFLQAHPDGPIQEVNLCNIDDLTARLFLEEAQRRYHQ
ncbi:MAG: macro domain-containing protein [Anaerolineae bacterium]|nr:macro domain-containing protein [Anaerolineae bacterium]MDW8100453.1 macro domain-containing protein [Anaerolineae bacterium]